MHIESMPLAKKSQMRRMMKWWVKKGGCCRGRAKELLAKRTVDSEVSRELAVQAAPHPQCVCVTDMQNEKGPAVETLAAFPRWTHRGRSLEDISCHL